MVPEKFRLDSIGRFLIAAFELRRPGLTAWTPQIERELLAESEAELVRMEVQCRELGVDDPAYWQKVRGALQSVLMPRYAVLAKDEIALAQAGYKLWRGGDLLSRVGYAGVGLVLGAAMVEIPWIPIEGKWVPWALFIAGPLIPDAQLWFYRRRYERRLNALVQDLGRAGERLDTYRSIAELRQTFGEPLSESASAPAVVAAANASITKELSTPPAATEPEASLRSDAESAARRLKH